MVQVEQPCKSRQLLTEEKGSLFSSLLDKNMKILASRNSSSAQDHLNRKSISEEEDISSDTKKTVDQNEQTSDVDIDTSTDTPGVIDTPRVVETTTSNRNAESSNSSSSADSIKMNDVDQEGALDRLMYDLSNDEISMVIDIFGATCDVGSNKPQSLPLFNSEPFMGPHCIAEDQEYSNQETRTHLAPPVLLPNHPALEFLGFDARSIGAQETGDGVKIIFAMG